MTSLRSQASIYYVARLILEIQTPLSIAKGQSDNLYDNLIVRDANGLPAIHGSSLAGVLRDLYEKLYGEAETKQLFGIAKSSSKETEEWASRIQVSWGCLHNQNDKPIEGLLEPNELKNSSDPIIQDALQAAPLRRDHVKLTHRGTAVDQGKFDRTSLTAGHRFSVEISLWSELNPDPRWNNLLNLFKHPYFRLGGNTRRGLGKIAVVRCAMGCFKLGEDDKDSKELARFSQLQPSLAETSLLEQISLSESSYPNDIIELRLTPAEGFRFGGLGQAWNEKHNQADATPLIEKRVIWENNSAEIQTKVLLFPASSFKGALSHRIAYHCHLLNNIFADGKTTETIQKECNNNPAVHELFGYVNENEKKGNALAGCLLFNDFYLTDDLNAVQLPHSGIDRFTGGVRDGVLFFEELMTCNQPLPLMTITLTESKSKFKPDVINALERTLDDLCNGYLALGAGSGRGGYGYFTGNWKWVDKGENQNAT